MVASLLGHHYYSEISQQLKPNQPQVLALQKGAFLDFFKELSRNYG